MFFSLFKKYLIKENKRKVIFFRADDVGRLTPKLRQLLEIFIKFNVPVDLAVIPYELDQPAADYLLELKRKYPDLINFHQHGFKHINYSDQAKQFEFGPMRSYSEQYQDIKDGQELLEKYLSGWDNIFTPPYHGYDQNTLKAVANLGFVCFSAGGYLPDNGLGLKELPISVDLLRWSRPPVLKRERELGRELKQALNRNSVVGICLHHEDFTADAFVYLEKLIKRLSAVPGVSFMNMRKIYEN